MPIDMIVQIRTLYVNKGAVHKPVEGHLVCLVWLRFYKPCLATVVKMGSIHKRVDEHRSRIALPPVRCC